MYAHAVLKGGGKSEYLTDLLSIFDSFERVLPTDITSPSSSRNFMNLNREVVCSNGLSVTLVIGITRADVTSRIN